MQSFKSALYATLLVAMVALPMAAPAYSQGAFVEEVATGSALVHEVDTVARQVLLETEDGRFLTYNVPDDVRNLEQVEVGDTVNVLYYGGIAASLAPAGQEPIVMDMATAMERAEEGERPAGATMSELTTTVTFDAFDSETGIVTFTGQSGIQRAVEVVKPDMRAFVETLKAGDMVDVTLIEIIAIEVAPGS
jgi:hypothetical protein